MIKTMTKNAIIGIGMALTIFCIYGIIFDILNRGCYALDNYNYTKMVIGCIVVGLGFGIPAAIYEKDSLPLPIRMLIHMGTGCVVYTIVAYSVGWISGTVTIIQGIITVALQLVVAFVIWILFMLHYRSEAKRMNEKIQSMK